MHDAPLSRRRFIAVAAAGVVVLASRRPESAFATPAADAARYVTQPRWSPPQLVVSERGEDVAPGYVFVAPFTRGAGSPGSSGPLILDDGGDPVWFLPLSSVRAQNFRAQTYRGRPVLTWYEGSTTGLYGGHCVIYDTAYQEVKRVYSGNHLSTDLHEFVITSRGTALLALAREVRADLGSVGGSKNARVVEGVVQEIDIETGRVLFTWRSLDHVSPLESFRTETTAAGNVDYFHLNSIGVARDGSLLISARHTSAVYKVNRRSGAVEWRLGGKRSDFTFGPGASFAFQHDARQHRDGSLTIFDNGAAEGPGGQVEPYSRPIRLVLDMNAMTADLVHTYLPPTPRLAVAMGNVQQLPDGGVFVGWGTAGGFTEFAPDGTVRLDATFADGSMSYRAFRLPWSARPRSRPSIVLSPTPAGEVAASVSWNGATDVASWQLLTGTQSGRLAAIASRARARTGFETLLPPIPWNGYVAVAALDAEGSILGTTPTLRLDPLAHEATAVGVHGSS